MENKPKTLIIFSFTGISDMLEKGNVWYVRHYEVYFDKVYVVYLNGNSHTPVVNGKTTLISLGIGKGKLKGIVNLLMVPWRFYRFSRKIKPTNYLTADLVFSWWISFFVKIFLKAKIILMPVCMPENIYRVSRQSLSGWLPKPIERIMTRLCFLNADKVLTGHGFGNFVGWLSGEKRAKNKLIIIDKIVEALPSPEFFKRLRGKQERGISKNDGRFSLLYIGRLHQEKMVDDLIKMMKRLRELKPGNNLRLILAGDGSQKSELLELAEDLKVKDCIDFVGYVKNEDLFDYYFSAGAFVSTMTGTSLREAALCGLPSVAYNHDWVVGVFKDKENILLVDPGDIDGLARAAKCLMENDELRSEISRNVKILAQRLWSEENLSVSLAEAFGQNL